MPRDGTSRVVVPVGACGAMVLSLFVSGAMSGSVDFCREEHQFIGVLIPLSSWGCIEVFAQHFEIRRGHS